MMRYKVYLKRSLDTARWHGRIKEGLVIEVPHLGEFTISHRTISDIEKDKVAADKAAATERKKAEAKKKTEAATALKEGEG